MNYNVYCYVERNGQRVKSDYGVFDALNQGDAINKAFAHFNKSHENATINIWDVVPSHEFVDDDDYSTGF